MAVNDILNSCQTLVFLKRLGLEKELENLTFSENVGDAFLINTFSLILQFSSSCQKPLFVKTLGCDTLLMPKTCIFEASRLRAEIRELDCF